MASNDGWEDVPVDTAHGWEDVPIEKAETAKLGKPGDMGEMGTGLFHTARHLSYGLGDKVVAGVNAVSDKLHDKTGKVTLGDAYARDLAFNDKTIEANDAAHPAGRWIGNAVGTAASLLGPGAVIKGGQLLRGLVSGVPVATTAVEEIAPRLLTKALSRQGMKTGLGLGAVGGFGASRGDWKDTALETGLGALTGGVLGAAAPYALAGTGKLLRYAGEKAKDLGGYLKINSIHPNPILGEAMEELPGGRTAVGRTLMEENLGGFTKHGTAKQLEAAKEVAGGAVDRLAERYRGPGVDVGPAIDSALQHAEELSYEPTTEAAAGRIADLANKYRDIYSNGPVDAATALKLKRALGDEVYGSKEELIKSGAKAIGDYGKGVSRLERGVNAGLDQELGPEFAAANLRYRQLLGASQAANRTASRGHSNHLAGGLMSMVAGTAGLAHGGTHEAIPAALASILFDKYGSQVGAQAAYRGGQLLGLGGDLSEALLPMASRAAQQVDPRTEALIAALRRSPPTPQMSPAAFAAREDSQ